MAKEHCLIVLAAGRKLDLLRGEASRVAVASKLGWWSVRAEVGTKFCFEDSTAKDNFALACDSFGITCREGSS
ncbi:hypothetical protein CT676_16805 [Bradyrhizobium sp. MOS001]|jgi:hypothetical protein|uniref:hypothetical protein n=1 Tax=unclassified Bradyrhizobium TaxID=2631580 RepID=UPI001074BC42|nr:hypothetical protein [Bradyrhizobium sp. MOS001]TFW60141.1 hypothetical protein CT676_16805 [Bradyrhizobium sp. MOS001]